MNEITKSITYLKEYKQLKQAVDEGKSPVLAVGLSAIHKAHLAAALGLDTGRPVLVLTDDDNAANRFAADLRGFAERDVVLLPSRELVMADVVGVSRGYEQRRLAVLDEMREARFAVASVQAAAQRTMPPELLVQSVVTLAAGETAPLDELAQSLTRAGYERCVQVEGTGQFSIRGGILDVFPPQAEHPYRVEFWDDEIDSISTFDVGSQRRLEQCECLRCLPCMESIPALAKGGAAGLAAAIDYIEKIGKKEIQAREEELTRYAFSKMKQIPGVHILGSEDPAKHCGILSFVVDGVHPHDIAAILNEDHVAVRAGHHCAQPLLTYLGVRSCTRASIAFYNTEEDIDRLIDSLKNVRREMGLEG